MTDKKTELDQLSRESRAQNEELTFLNKKIRNETQRIKKLQHELESLVDENSNLLEHQNELLKKELTTKTEKVNGLLKRLEFQDE